MKKKKVRINFGNLFIVIFIFAFIVYGILFLYIILIATVHGAMIGSGIISKEERDLLQKLSKLEKNKSKSTFEKIKEAFE